MATKTFSELPAADSVGASDLIPLMQGGVTKRGTPAQLPISWDQLIDVPSAFAPSSHTHPWGELTDVPSTFAPSAHTHPWGELTDVPSTFAPSAHTHPWSEITGTEVVALLAGNQTFSGTNTISKGWSGGGQGGLYINSAAPIIEIHHTAGGGSLPRHLIEGTGPGLIIGGLNPAASAYLYFMDMADDNGVHECIFQGFHQFTIESTDINLSGDTEVFGSFAIPPGLSHFTSDSAAASGGIPVGGFYRNNSAVQIRVT